jgi:hypothetical protein
MLFQAAGRVNAELVPRWGIPERSTVMKSPTPIPWLNLLALGAGLFFDNAN